MVPFIILPAGQKPAAGGEAELVPAGDVQKNKPQQFKLNEAKTDFKTSFVPVYLNFQWHQAFLFETSLYF